MLTRLDQIANQNHLQLVKAILPYLPANSQKTFSVLIKLMEIQNILTFYPEASHCPAPANIPAGGQDGAPPDLLDILTDIRQYCEGEEQEMIDQALQMISMMELYSLFREPA